MEHRGKVHKDYDNRRGSSSQRGYDARWQRYRKAYLAEHPLCVVCEEQSRVVEATEVDHIIPVSGSKDPLFWDEGNHQALCKQCHSRKTMKELSSRGATAQVMIVAGPPGSGKSAYVAGRSRPGDIIVDFDVIVQAISGLPLYEKPGAVLPFGEAVRNLLYRMIAEPSAIGRAWVIAGLPSASDRGRLSQRLKARVVVIETSPTECFKRITKDERRADRAELWQPLIEHWWQSYTRGTGETVL